MGSIIKRPPRPEGNWNQVPERLLQGLPNVIGVEKQFWFPRPVLSGWARTVGGWIHGRPDGWEMRVAKAKSILRVSDYHWENSVNALIAFGYLKRWKWSEGRKGIHTEYKLLEPAQPLKPLLPSSTFLIPGFIGPEKFRHEVFKPKRTTNKNKGLSSEDSLLKEPTYQTEVQISMGCYEQARAEFVGYDIDALEKLWISWVRKRIRERGNKEIPKFPDKAFMAWATKYVVNNPLPHAAKEFG